LKPKLDLNPHANERYDIDAAFCETGVWYIIHLKPGYIMYLPMHWWHQVSDTAPLAHILAV
jgi:ribosomal protein L16 Arg81 hydroxylase